MSVVKNVYSEDNKPITVYDAGKLLASAGEMLLKLPKAIMMKCRGSAQRREPACGCSEGDHRSGP